MSAWLAANLSPFARWVIGVLLLVVVVLLLVDGLPALDSTTISACLLVVAALVALGAGNLYRKRRSSTQPEHRSDADLAIALLGGAVVGLLLFGFQLALGAGNEARQFNLLLGSAPDLTGFSPPRDADDRPIEGAYSLAGAHLRGKVMRLADLTDVDLRGADASFAQLSGARLVGADLTDANLRVAYIYFADLRCACLRDANLGDVDLRNADVRGADLRGANLDGADLRGWLTDEETLLDDGATDGACTQLDDVNCGAEARRIHPNPASATAGPRRDLAAPEPRTCEPVR